MFSVGGRRNKKAEADQRKVVSITWQEKKELVEKEEEELRKDIEELTTWVDMIETMNDQQLKGYVEIHQGDSKMSTGQRMKDKSYFFIRYTLADLTNQTDTNRFFELCKVHGAGKSKSLSSGIMASVWKFHKK